MVDPVAQGAANSVVFPGKPVAHLAGNIFGDIPARAFVLEDFQNLDDVVELAVGNVRDHRWARVAVAVGLDKGAAVPAEIRLDEVERRNGAVPNDRRVCIAMGRSQFWPEIYA